MKIRIIYKLPIGLFRLKKYILTREKDFSRNTSKKKRNQIKIQMWSQILNTFRKQILPSLHSNFRILVFLSRKFLKKGFELSSPILKLKTLYQPTNACLNHIAAIFTTHILIHFVGDFHYIIDRKII